MRNIFDSVSGGTDVVEDQLGESYLVVREVRDNLAAITNVSASVDAIGGIPAIAAGVITTNNNVTSSNAAATAASGSATSANTSATNAQIWAQTVAPKVTVNIEAPEANKTYPRDFNIANGLTFTRFNAELVGTGSAQIAVIANGVVYGPVTVDDDGFTATIALTIPAGNDIAFSVPSITGTVSFIHVSLDGEAA